MVTRRIWTGNQSFGDYYGSNMTQSKFLEFLGIGISMSAGYLSNLLIKTTRTFILRKVKSMKRDLLVVLGSTLKTTARVAGVNYTTNIVCNPIYTVYFTTEKKDRLTVLKGLQNEQEQFLLNPLTYDLLETFQIPKKSRSL